VLFDEWSKAQKYAGFFLFEIVFWTLVLGFGFWVGFPGNGLFVGMIAAANILIGVAGWYVTKEEAGFTGYATTQKQQLKEEQAYKLTRYMLAYRRGYRVGRVRERGIDPAVAPSDDKDDAVRLFKLEFEPLNRSGKATVYLDLEQELSVDKDDIDSLDSAVDQVQNVRIVKSWTSVNYEDKVVDVKESLGRSSSPTITTIREGEEGRIVEERPALTNGQNQSGSNSGSADAES
jgi:hypothetical protein